MRFMIIIKSTPDSEAGKMPPPETFEAMGRFNQALIDAGVLLAAEGLHPSSQGARIVQKGDRKVVTDGPFAEARELIGGFWVITAKSRDEALAWLERVPLPEAGELELRRVYEAADFAEVMPDSEIAREQAWRDANQQPINA